MFKCNRPAIYTEEELNKVKEILLKRNKPSCLNKNNLKDHLNKKVYLKETNRLMRYNRMKPNKERCTYRNEVEKKNISANDLHEILYNECKTLIKEAIKSKENLYKLLKDKIENKTQVAVLKRLNKEKRLLDKQFEIQFERKLNGTIDESQYIKIISVLNTKYKLIEEQIKKESTPAYKKRN